MRLFQVLLILLFCSVNSYAEDIKLRPNNAVESKERRAPIRVPNASIEGNTLTFDASCIGCPLALMQDDAVVYATVISENAEGNGGEVVLPDYLAGQYEIQIEYGSIILVGEIEL